MVLGISHQEPARRAKRTRLVRLKEDALVQNSLPLALAKYQQYLTWLQNASAFNRAGTDGRRCGAKTGGLVLPTNARPELLRRGGCAIWAGERF